MPANPRRLRRRVEVQLDHAVVAQLGGHEERRLALVDLLEHVAVGGQLRRQRRYPARVVQQRLKPQVPGEIGELLDDLLQPLR
jgi:hypothetical protein